MTQSDLEDVKGNDDTPVVQLSMNIPGNVAGITPCVDRILAIAAATGCGAGHEFEIETALREAMANAIVHGCGEDPGKEVLVTVACTRDESIVIIVSDPGKGFDPEAVPDPVEGSNVLSDHGRGIFLINRLMDEVRIERGGSRIWMRKQKPTPDDAS
jgi:serine/threonine-protein kinase RsbW